MPAVDVQTMVEIERPRDAVAAFAADPDNAPDWYVNIKSVEWMTPPPAQVGSRITFVAYFLGRRLQYTYEITLFEPGRRLIMRTAEGPFPMETTYAWQPLTDTRTRMTLRNRGRPTGFSAVVAPFLSFMMKRANEKDLEKLKKILEGSAQG